VREWRGMGEYVLAKWFLDHYLKEGFKGFTVGHSIPGSGTDNNALESFNNVIKICIDRKKASPKKFIYVNLPKILAMVSLKYSGKVDGKEDTLGDRDNVDQRNFIKTKPLLRAEVLKCSQLLSNGNCGDPFSIVSPIDQSKKTLVMMNSSWNLTNSDDKSDINYITNETSLDYYNNAFLGEECDESYATIEEARYKVSKYHVVEKIVLNNKEKYSCTCKFYMRNANYCCHTLVMYYKFYPTKEHTLPSTNDWECSDVDCDLRNFILNFLLTAIDTESNRRITVD
jgi:hypothetical protein